MELGTQLVPIDQIDPAFGSFLQLENGRPKRDLGVAGLCGLQGCPAVQGGMRCLGPDIADNVCDLLVVQPLGVFFRLLLRECCQRQR